MLLDVEIPSIQNEIDPSILLEDPSLAHAPSGASSDQMSYNMVSKADLSLLLTN